MVAKYIAIRQVLDLCERSNQQPGLRVSWWWWEQARIDLETAKKRAAESATVLDLESGSELESKLESEFESESESDLESETDS